MYQKFKIHKYTSSSYGAGEYPSAQVPGARPAMKNVFFRCFFQASILSLTFHSYYKIWVFWYSWRQIMLISWIKSQSSESWNRVPKVRYTIPRIETQVFVQQMLPFLICSHWIVYDSLANSNFQFFLYLCCLIQNFIILS